MSIHKYFHPEELSFDKELKKDIFKVPKLTKDSSLEEVTIQDDIFLVRSDYSTNEDIVFKTEASINGIVININFKGNNFYKSEVSSYDIQFLNNLTTISYLNDEQGIEYLKKDSKVECLSIIVKEEFLKNNLTLNKNIETIYNKSDKQFYNELLKKAKTNHKISLLAKDIYNCQYTNDLEKVFIHSRVLEIIFLELQELFIQNENPKYHKVKFSEYDKEAVYLAKDILINNMQNPPSIIELAKLVKLNEFKLKIGFKKFFHNTPYKFLHSYKMNKAKELLENSDMNVSEVSYEVGYKYIHSFSRVFAQEFGVLPKELMKKRKYYY